VNHASEEKDRPTTMTIVERVSLHGDTAISERDLARSAVPCPVTPRLVDVEDDVDPAIAAVIEAADGQHIREAILALGPYQQLLLQLPGLG
jgi:hypothetical protein